MGNKSAIVLQKLIFILIRLLQGIQFGRGELFLEWMSLFHLLHIILYNCFTLTTIKFSTCCKLLSEMEKRKSTKPKSSGHFWWWVDYRITTSATFVGCEWNRRYRSKTPEVLRHWEPGCKDPGEAERERVEEGEKGRESPRGPIRRSSEGLWHLTGSVFFTQRLSSYPLLQWSQ